MPEHLNDETRAAGADPRQPTDTSRAAELLTRNSDLVIAEWRNLVPPGEWARLPPSRLVDSLPEILPRLVRDARNGATCVSDDVKVIISEEHGSIRREDDVPVSALAEEWELLKEACVRLLERNGVPAGDVSALLERLDLLLDDALGYTLRGYYREELDSLRGRGLERRDRDEDRRRSAERKASDRRRDRAESDE